MSKEEIKDLSIVIEEELYELFTDTGHKYKNKYRSLLFNIKDKKNMGLFRKILTGLFDFYSTLYFISLAISIAFYDSGILGSTYLNNSFITIMKYLFSSKKHIFNITIKNSC